MSNKLSTSINLTQTAKPYRVEVGDTFLQYDAERKTYFVIVSYDPVN